MKFVSTLGLAALCLGLSIGAPAAPKLAPEQAANSKCDDLPRANSRIPRRVLSGAERAVVPILNSRPNATAVIYLDFDGETVTDPSWNNGNTIVAPAYDLSADEVTAIFNRVKEDWWPFKINVTTDPALYTKAAVGQRMRCIITSNDAAGPGTGGVAYLTSFRNAGKFGFSTTIPCWVFNQDVVSIAEAISHEVGHTMGLRHDGKGTSEYYLGHGTGATSWAPIMGAGYYVNVSQWSKGEYAEATNKTEDDVAIIASTENGFGFIGDEAGDTLATASPLAVAANGTVGQVGCISSSTDADLFKFQTSGGTINLTGNVAAVGANLDLGIEILDGSGGVVISSKPEGKLEATLSTTLTAGTYYLRVLGTGNGDANATGYTNYGSIGAYNITGDFPVVIVTPDISISDVTVTEGDTGSTNAIFTVSLSTNSNQPVTVDYATGAGTATEVEDYGAVNGTATIPASMLSTTIVVPVYGDTKGEGDETFFVNLSNAAGGNLIDNRGVGTIQDDDVPQLSIEDVTVTEGDSGSTKAQFKFTLSEAFPNPVSVKYATANVTATAGKDYTATSGTLVLPAGTTSGVVEVTILGDVLDEADETFGLQLTEPTNVSLPRPFAVGTILDDDGSVSVSVNDPSVTEADTTNVQMNFKVSLSSASGQTVSVFVETAEAPKDPATRKLDFVSLPSQELIFLPGETSKTVSVTIKGDTIRELNERLRLVITSATNASVAKNFGVGTILENDPDPRVNIESTSVVEGNSGTVKAKFLVTLTSPTYKDVTVTCTTKKGTATGNVDFVAKSATATIPAGQTVTTFGVLVNGDLLDELDETFSVVLSEPVGATLGKRFEAECTIQDDDNKPTITVSDISAVEGDSGTSYFRFPVRLSAPSGRDIQVTYKTEGITASRPADFKAVSGTLVIPAGQTLGVIEVPVFGDTEIEQNELFYVELSAPLRGNLGRSFATGTIIDNDQKTELSISDARLTEGHEGYRTMKFTVSLTEAITRDVTFVAETSQSKEFPATAGEDFIPLSKTFTIPAGQTSVVIPVSVYGDTLDEFDERVRVVLSLANNATIADNIGVGTIVNDDTAPVVAIIGEEDFGSTYVWEGDSGTVEAPFYILLSEPSGKPITVTYVTGNYTADPTSQYAAAAGKDYVAVEKTITIPAGVTEVPIAVQVKGDLLAEQDEYFGVGLRNPQYATLDEYFYFDYGVIMDDDQQPALSIASVSQSEGNSFSKAFNFEITLSAPAGVTVTVDVATAKANVKPATAGEDYVALAPTTVTFLPGETKKTVSVMVKGDTKVEDEERFRVTLSNPTYAFIDTPFATGYILNDDGPTPSAQTF